MFSLQSAHLLFQLGPPCCPFIALYDALVLHLGQSRAVLLHLPVVELQRRAHNLQLPATLLLPPLTLRPLGLHIVHLLLPLLRQLPPQTLKLPLLPGLLLQLRLRPHPQPPLVLAQLLQLPHLSYPRPEFLLSQFVVLLHRAVDPLQQLVVADHVLQQFSVLLLALGLHLSLLCLLQRRGQLLDRALAHRLPQLAHPARYVLVLVLQLRPRLRHYRADSLLGRRPPLALEPGYLHLQSPDLLLEHFDVAGEGLLVDDGLDLDHLGAVGEVEGREGLLEAERRLGQGSHDEGLGVAPQAVLQHPGQLRVAVGHVRLVTGQGVDHHPQRGQRLVDVAGLLEPLPAGLGHLLPLGAGQVHELQLGGLEGLAAGLLRLHLEVDGEDGVRPRRLLVHLGLPGVSVVDAGGEAVHQLLGRSQLLLPDLVGGLPLFVDVQQVEYLLVVEFAVGAADGELDLPAPADPGKQLPEGPAHQFGHGVGLAGAGLPVGQHRAVEAVEAVLDDPSPHRLEDVLLGGIGGEDAVEGETVTVDLDLVAGVVEGGVPLLRLDSNQHLNRVLTALRLHLTVINLNRLCWSPCINHRNRRRAVMAEGVGDNFIMNNEFWCRVQQRGNNPSMTSSLMTSLIHKQEVLQKPSKMDYQVPVKLYDRQAPLLPRSQSLSSKVTDLHNPEPHTHTRSSMMSQAGSNSLSKLKPLSNDREVFEKQRSGREMDILSHAPRDYKDSIKVFPKIRFENYDRDYWRRKSFIEGLPLDAYNHYTPVTKPAKS